MIAMDVELRAAAPEEFDTWALAVERAFGQQPKQEEIDLFRPTWESDRSLAVFEGPRIVATGAAFGTDLTVPGGTLPMAAVTAVGVAPTHRRRGLLTMMMRRQLDDVHDRGEPLAGLWASESIIYQRFGYGLAVSMANLEIDRQRTAFLPPFKDEGRVTLVEKQDALRLFPPVLDRVTAGQPGMWQRSQGWWELIVADLESWRDGASALFFAAHESPSGAVDGYVNYRIKQDWNEQGPGNELRVRELTAENDQAYAALWRFCFDLDLVGKIDAWARRPDEPVRYLLADPRRLVMKIIDSLWIRVVDVPAALAGRRYSVEGRLTFEVRDGFCPWTEGRYELEGGPDGASCRPTDDEPDLILDARDLGAIYLGGTAPTVLTRAGRILEATEGAARRADLMFAWDPGPWCPTVF
jgi:predicted acetyltransferase